MNFGNRFEDFRMQTLLKKLAFLPRIALPSRQCRGSQPSEGCVYLGNQHLFPPLGTNNLFVRRAASR